MLRYDVIPIVLVLRIKSGCLKQVAVLSGVGLNLRYSGETVRHSQRPSVCQHGSKSNKLHLPDVRSLEGVMAK